MTDQSPPSETEEEDPWAAALQEQAAAEAAAMASASQTEVTDSHQESHSGASQMLEQYSPGVPVATPSRDLDIILDINIKLTVELGRTKISIRNLLQLAHGSVVELDSAAGEQLHVYANGTLVAKGEVVVVNDKFGIRIIDIVTPEDRIRRLQR